MPRSASSPPRRFATHASSQISNPIRMPLAGAPPRPPATAAATIRGRAAAEVASAAPSRADLLIYAALGVALSYVWRIHDLIPILGALQFPSLISLLVMWLYANDQDPRRAMRVMSPHAIFRIVMFLGLLTVLSVPTSVHDGASFRFLTGDLWKNLLLLIVLAGAVRSFEASR